MQEESEEEPVEVIPMPVNNIMLDVTPTPPPPPIESPKRNNPSTFALYEDVSVEIKCGSLNDD